MASRGAFALAFAGLALALPGCTTQSAAPSAAARPIGAVHIVRMTASNEFDPQEIRIRAGDVVEWRNTSRGAQTVTLLRAAAPMLVALPTGALEFDSGRIASGATYRRQFTIGGRYQYLSTTNAGVTMAGVVLVLDR